MLYKSSSEQDDYEFVQTQIKWLKYLKNLAETIKSNKLENCYQESSVTKSEYSLKDDGILLLTKSV